MTKEHCTNFTHIDDHSLYLTLKRLGLVNSQFEFGSLCGRSKSWYSSIRTKRFQLSIASLTLLAAALTRLSSEGADRQRLIAARRAHAVVKRHLDIRCGAIHENSRG